MYLPHVVTLTLALAPALASAAIFPRDTHVKLLEAKDFRKQVLKQNRTSVVAFVAPWCGHCQRLAPEYSKAAASLDPLIPLYAVDCDAEQNKRLCSDQGVKGFPTVKIFPRGDKAPPIPYNEERTAKALIEFASQAVPHGVRKQDSLSKITSWVSKDTSKPRALLLSVPKSSKETDMPLLWKVLANQFKPDLLFAAHPDPRSKTAITMGFSGAESKVLIYPVGETTPVLYEGKLKYAALEKFFKELLDGSIDLASTTSTPTVAPTLSSSSLSDEEVESSSDPIPTPSTDTPSEILTPEPELDTAQVILEAETPSQTPTPDVTESIAVPDATEPAAAEPEPEPYAKFTDDPEPEAKLEPEVLASVFPNEAPGGSAGALHESSLAQGEVPTPEPNLDASAAEAISEAETPAPTPTPTPTPDATEPTALASTPDVITESGTASASPSSSSSDEQESEPEVLLSASPNEAPGGSAGALHESSLAQGEVPTPEPDLDASAAEAVLKADATFTSIPIPTPDVVDAAEPQPPTEPEPSTAARPVLDEDVPDPEPAYAVGDEPESASDSSGTGSGHVKDEL